VVLIVMLDKTNVSIQRLDAGEGLPLAEVMEGIRSEYE